MTSGPSTGALDCRDLTGYDLRAPGQHDAFVAAGVWRELCMRQVEFAVTRMAPLADEEAVGGSRRSWTGPPPDAPRQGRRVCRGMSR